MPTTTNRIHRQRGAVSIFIVIFTALLVTVVTASFIQIMLRNQQQATDNDLSQSAYDSAMAGVEDAKRALVNLKKCQRDASLPGCASLQSVISSQGDTNCEVLGDPAVDVADFGTNDEVQVGDASLNQAYTCVKIKVETDSYEGTFLNQGDTVVIPLLPVGDPNAMQAVRIYWYTNSDLPLRPDGTPYSLQLPTDTRLKNFTSWANGVPPIMRAQLMQFDKNQPLDLTSFDGGNARTRFLYPFYSLSLPNNGGSFALDNRRNNPSLISVGGCQDNFNAGGFACAVDLALPPMGVGELREAYLQLASIYNKGTVHYKVQLLNSVGSSNIVNFDNVQPQVDSTGRASDLFRRVRARVTVTPSGSPLPFPEAPITTDNLCKEFFITNNSADYNGNSNGDAVTCTP